MRALIVDDSQAIRNIVSGMLKELGYDIFEAGDGQEAMDLLRRQGRIDLAIVDWNMPKPDGYDFVRQVRQDPAYGDLKIMMVTTETERAQIAKALEAGANEYIMKPFTKEVISIKLSLLGLPYDQKDAA